MGDISVTKQLLVICGSMTHYARMLDARNWLLAKDIPAKVPEDETIQRATLTNEAFSAYKRQVSDKYFRLIRSKPVFGILVINDPKHGISDYIGANTFAEIAIAFNANKRIYLLNGIPEVFAEELVSWGAIPLRAYLDPVVEHFTSIASQSAQYSLFGDIAMPEDKDNIDVDYSISFRNRPI